MEVDILSEKWIKSNNCLGSKLYYVFNYYEMIYNFLYPYDKK